MPTPRATTRNTARSGSRTPTRRTKAVAATPEPEAAEATPEVAAAAAPPAEQVAPEAAAEETPAPVSAEPEPESAPAAEPEPTLEEVEEAVQSPADALIDTVTTRQQEAIESAESAGAAMFDGLGRVQREIASFVTDRIRQDMETQRALLQCRTFEDVREVQSRFFRSAIEQYSAETNRLMALGRQIMTRSAGRE